MTMTYAPTHTPDAICADCTGLLKETRLDFTNSTAPYYSYTHIPGCEDCYNSADGTCENGTYPCPVSTCTTAEPVTCADCDDIPMIGCDYCENCGDDDMYTETRDDNYEWSL